MYDIKYTYINSICVEVTRNSRKKWIKLNWIKIDDIITGKVVRIIDRGAFVEIKEGVEAFLPISHLKEDRVANVSSVVNPGDEVTVRVLTLDPSHKRMSVSIKDVNKEPEEDYSEFLNTEEELGSTIGDLLKGKLNNPK